MLVDLLSFELFVRAQVLVPVGKEVWQSAVLLVFTALSLEIIILLRPLLLQAEERGHQRGRRPGSSSVLDGQHPMISRGNPLEGVKDLFQGAVVTLLLKCGAILICPLVLQIWMRFPSNYL